MRGSSRVVLQLLAAFVATAGCIDTIDAAPGPCAGDDGCAQGERCVEGSCAASCETGAEACRRAGTSCGDTTERCSGALVACAQLAELCEEELPGSVCGDGGCCLPDCGGAVCGQVTCDGLRCLESCPVLATVQSPTFGDPAWPPDRPMGRSGAAFAVDPVSGRGLLFGGSTRTPTPADVLAKTVHGDSWWLEADGLSWTPVTTALAPAPRLNARLAFHEAQGVFLCFGGLVFPEAGAEEYSDELWLLDAGGWRQLVPAGPAPRSRGLHAFAYDSEREEVVLLGGTAAGEPLDDQWALAFDGVEASWRRVEPAASPTPRAGATLARAGGGLVLHGGTASLLPGASPESDSWLWDGQTWTPLALSGEEPPRREEACSAPLPDGRLLLAGGANDEGPVASPLILDVVARTLSPAGGFSSRSGCLGGAVGGVPTIGYGVARGRNPDDLWRLGGG